MDSSTITTDNFTLAGSEVSGTVTYDSDTYTATFTPDANLGYNHEYTATLSTDITDKAGNSLAEEYSWSFTTLSGPAPPPPDYFSEEWIEKVVNWASAQEGKDCWYERCMGFVSDAFKVCENRPGSANDLKDSLESAGVFYSKENGWEPPRGSVVFFSANHPYEDEGHIGISLGGGRVIHSLGTVRIETIDEIEENSVINSYLGWAYPPEGWFSPKISNTFEVGDSVFKKEGWNLRDIPSCYGKKISDSTTITGKGTIIEDTGTDTDINGIRNGNGDPSCGLHYWWYIKIGDTRGWCAEEGLDQPPICAIELRNDGVKIDEIDVGEFFDIYVGDSTDDTGIIEVRFSSDESQDDNPTGEWTEWYDWDTSSGDWDADTKIKRWAFDTGGEKEVWAEVKDDAGNVAQCHANIFVHPAENQPPDPPTLLSQYKIDGTEIPVGGTTDENTVILKGVVNDPDDDQVKLQIELRRLDEYGGSFTGEYTQESEWFSSGSEASITVFGLVPDAYHWQARAVDETDAKSDWVSFGDNPDSEVDFSVAKILPVPYYSQDGTEWCVPTSMSMIFKYYGKPIHPWDIAESWDWPRKDIPGWLFIWERQAWIVREYFKIFDLTTNFEFPVNFDTIKAQINQNMPVFLALHPIEHAVVIVGYDTTSEKFYISDPSGAFVSDELGLGSPPYIAVPVDRNDVAKYAGGLSYAIAVDGNPSYPEGTIDINDVEGGFYFHYEGDETKPMCGVYSWRCGKDGGIIWDSEPSLHPLWLDQRDLFRYGQYITNHMEDKQSYLLEIKFAKEGYSRSHFVEIPDVAGRSRKGDIMVDSIPLREILDESGDYTITLRLWDGDSTKIYDVIVFPSIEYTRFIEFYLCSPADLFITDPEGFHVGLDPTTGQVVNEIPGAVYTGPGSEPQIISIPGRKIGDYLVTVVPHPDASPTDTFTIEVKAENTTLVLAKDVPISDIPCQSYRINSTSTGISSVSTEIAIEKTVSLTGTCPGSDPLTVHTGDNVTYCYTVTNKGDLTLTNVTVTDDLYGPIAIGTTTLAPGASTSGTLMHVVTESDIPSVTNIATANGTNPYGVTVSDTDACTINVEIHPALNVIKTASPTEGEPGTTITFTINVTNTGDCTLNPVKVVDTLPAGLNYVSSYPTASTHDGSVIWNNVGPFAVGASKTLTLVAQIGNDAPALINNLVTVTGTPPVGGNVTASDTAKVIVIRLELEKSGSPATVAPGGTVTYTIKYSNPGGKDLTNVVITENYSEGVTFISADPAPDAGTNNKWTLGTLPAGASGQIIIKLKVPESRDLSFTESGTVTGEGFVMVSKDLSTEQKPYSFKNVVTLSCTELAPVTASASTTVSGVPETSLELTEHGSGIYSSDEILNLQTKNKSIMLQKSTEAEYQPTSFNFSDGFAVNFATKWMQDICARNIIMGDAMHKKIKDASYIKDETIAEVGGYRTSMEFESSFYGAAHIGTVSKSAKTSEDYIGAFEITWAGREECQYLFNWSRVPGNDTETDNEKVIRFLVDVLDIKWAENATITKSADEMSINITDNGNTATITIDANKKTATVKVGGETIYVLEVRIEDDTLNIYDCKLEKMEESVSGIGYVMMDKDLAAGQIQVREHGSGNYSSDMNFESGRLDKVTEAEYQPTTFNFSDGFAITFPSNWMQGICAKDKKAGTAIHKKISDASSMVDDTTATKSSMEFETSFNGSMHIGARTDGTRISEDYIGVFNITELIKIGKPAISTPSTPTPDWLPCPFPKPSPTPASGLPCPSSDP